MRYVCGIVGSVWLGYEVEIWEVYVVKTGGGAEGGESPGVGKG